MSCSLVMPFAQVQLEDCLMDGPPLLEAFESRETLLTSEDLLLRALSKALKLGTEVGEVQSKTVLSVSEGFVGLGKFECEHGDDPQGLLVQFGERLKAIESIRKDQFAEIEGVICVGFEGCLRGDLARLQKLKLKNEKARMDFTYSINRFMVKSKNEPGTIEAAAEVSQARKELHESNLALAVLINEAILKRKSSVFDGALQYLDCRLKMAEREAEELRQIREHLRELHVKTFISVEALEEAKKQASQRTEELKNKSKEAYNPLSGVDTNSASPSLSHSSLSGGSTELERSGYLYKRSSHAFHPVWGRRYFMLRGDKLVYHSLGGKGDQSKVSIDLRLCNVQPIDDPERLFCFDLNSPIRAYRLQAENEADLQAWIEAIKKGIHLALQHNFANSPAANQNLISREFGISHGGGQDELIRSILDANGIELCLTDAAKRAIKTIPGNSHCADCRAEAPDWASISFGILVCIQCSGIHRSLGVHLSKIRSLNLDFWNPENVELMLALGNERSWSIFEEIYTEDSDSESCRRPQPESSQAVKEQWIMAKYGLRQFVKQPEAEDSEAQIEQIRAILWDGIEKDDALLVLKALALGAPVDDTLIEDDFESAEECEDEEGLGRKQFVQTALQRAAQLGHWQCLALLLLWGGDGEAVDSQGRNLVHYLSDLPAERIPMLLTVLRKNAALGGVEDESGLTPLQLAEQAQNGQVATIMRVFKSQCEKRGLVSSRSGSETPVPPSSSGFNGVKDQLVEALNKVLHLSRPFRRSKRKKRTSVIIEESK